MKRWTVHSPLIILVWLQETFMFIIITIIIIFIFIIIIIKWRWIMCYTNRSHTFRQRMISISNDYVAFVMNVKHFYCNYCENGKSALEWKRIHRVIDVRSAHHTRCICSTNWDEAFRSHPPLRRWRKEITFHCITPSHTSFTLIS